MGTINGKVLRPIGSNLVQPRHVETTLTDIHSRHSERNAHLAPEMRKFNLPRPGKARAGRPPLLKGSERVDFSNPKFHTKEYIKSYCTIRNEVDREHIALDRVYQVNNGTYKPRQSVRKL